MIKGKLFIFGIATTMLFTVLTITAYAGQWKNTSGDNWRYKRDDNTYIVNDWLEDGSSLYHFNARGYMQKGWQRIGGRWHYFLSDGKMHTGWLQLGDQWYYLKPDGKLHTGWLQLDDKWYYLRSDGKMHTGWLELEGDWYYFDSDGVRKTGWQDIKGVRYLFYNKTGIMHTGVWPESYVTVPKNMGWDEIRSLSEELYDTYYDQLLMILEETNITRREKGVAELQLDRTFCLVAMSRSIHMMSYNYYSHFYASIPQVLVVGDMYGVDLIGENCARATNDPVTPVEDWRKSEGHYANMISPRYTKIGIGYIPNGFAVQVFAE